MFNLWDEIVVTLVGVELLLDGLFVSTLLVFLKDKRQDKQDCTRMRTVAGVVTGAIFLIGVSSRIMYPVDEPYDD